MYKKAFFSALMGVFFFSNVSLATESETVVKNTVINLIKLDDSKDSDTDRISKVWIKFVFNESVERENSDYNNTFEKPKNMNEKDSKDNFKKCTE